MQINFAQIKKTRRFRREQTIFNELLTASEDEGLLARKGIERSRQAPRTISKKLCKFVQKNFAQTKKTRPTSCFFSGAADQT